MKKQQERKYIDDLIRQTKDSIQYFSNHSKRIRERSVCAAFLRCLGIEFTLKEIQSNKDDPPDVVFRSARLEVFELYDERRKRHDEYKERLKELEKAKRVEDAYVAVHQPKPISYSTLLSQILIDLRPKGSKYGRSQCSDLDALVYIGIPGWFLDISSPIPETKELLNQGWRSLSFVIIPYTHIVFCETKCSNS